MEDKRSSDSFKKLVKKVGGYENAIFIGILALAIIIRLYYFTVTNGQPLWWDEADYLAYAKNIAGFPVDWVVTAKHNSLYPFLIGALFKIGFGETAVKFLYQLLPSVATVALSYFLAVKMYGDKRLGLIVCALVAFFWVHLFNTMRFHLDIPAFFVGLVACFVFWQGYEKREKIFGKYRPSLAIPLAVVLVVLTYAIRRGYFLYGLFFLGFMLITRKPKELLSNRMNWIGLGVAILALLLVESTIFTSTVGELSEGYFHGENPLNLLTLDVFDSFFLAPSLLFYIFLAGMVVMGWNIISAYGLWRKENNRVVRADIFNILCIVIMVAFFIFILRSQTVFGEPRWFLPIAFACFVAVGRGTLAIGDYLAKYAHVIGIIFPIVVLLIGGYSQLTHAHVLINDRVASYDGIKQAGLLVRANAGLDDVVVAQATPQAAYYSERSVMKPKTFTNWDGENTNVPFELFLETLVARPEAKFLLISFSEPNHPSWMKQVGAVNGQIPVWSIPFMNTTINFATGQEDIVPSATYGETTFTLVDVKQDVFVYRITH